MTIPCLTLKLGLWREVPDTTGSRVGLDPDRLEPPLSPRASSGVVVPGLRMSPQPLCPWDQGHTLPRSHTGDGGRNSPSVCRCGRPTPHQNKNLTHPRPSSSPRPLPRVHLASSLSRSRVREESARRSPDSTGVGTTNEDPRDRRRTVRKRTSGEETLKRWSGEG